MEIVIYNSRIISKVSIIYTYKVALVKLTKYYSRIEGKGRLIYNLTNILDPFIKLSLYKT